MTALTQETSWPTPPHSKPIWQSAKSKRAIAGCSTPRTGPGSAALFTEDLVLDVSEGTSVPVMRGREEALQQVQTLVGSARTVHQVHTPEIDVQGDEAHVIWAMQDRVVWDEPRRGLASITGYGHYHERYVRQNGEWKIASLKLTRLHIDAQPAL